MGQDESALALLAATSDAAREELITRQEKNILRIVSRAKASLCDEERRRMVDCFMRLFTRN